MVFNFETCLSILKKNKQPISVIKSEVLKRHLIKQIIIIIVILILLEFHTVGGTISPGFHRSSYRHSSISAGSDRVSLASAIPSTVKPQSGESSELTPQQYGVMGKLPGLVLFFICFV